ncbi:Ribosome maturation factor RimP [wastewater metagenome]|uniref:Ribosome maturation factor RimP n=2 Tax=unclassified sequences TaxID=12908 RepID=A0A5B8R5I2_9ZZZZ|nr:MULTISPECIES: ribosome maturation factor RimP [Arhodomonas]MCS4504664.1 ribosome maturation factor RimP [Arhodomonas aquaeolei]QEA04069.1 ribosome maturation factor RimP [uncultured organism]
MAAAQRLTEILQPVVEAMGYEFVGLEYHPNSKRGLLRIYIDTPEGIDVDDCEAVSHQVSGVLDVEDPIPAEYNLEISSPGLERPLFKPADYDRFVGERIRIRIRGRHDGRRSVRGVLRGLRDDAVAVDEDGEEVLVPLEVVDRANLELEPEGR